MKGCFDLPRNVFGSWKTIRLGENTIKHFHDELAKHADRDRRHRGDCKKSGNAVETFDRAGKSPGIVLQPTRAYPAPEEIQELVEWTNAAVVKKKYHPLLIISNFHVEPLKIHRFRDGQR